MDAFSAKVSSKGQVTVPKPIREALAITDGEVVFRLDGHRIVVARHEADLQAPEPPHRTATPRLPWDATRRAALQPRGRTRRRPGPVKAPEPTIVVDLRAPATVRSGSRGERHTV
jgi:antitoxin PrlF